MGEDRLFGRYDAFPEGRKSRTSRFSGLAEGNLEANSARERLLRRVDSGIGRLDAEFVAFSSWNPLTPLLLGIPRAALEGGLQIFWINELSR